MTTIELHTKIKAPIEDVFDLSRSIDFHMKSASGTKEQAIGGRTSGLIGYGETVTWRGKHFGVFLKHTSKIVDYEYPLKFTDVMIEGHFKYFGHRHYFRSEGNYTHMIDQLSYRVPYGLAGKAFNWLFLNSHLTNFLKRRNAAIKKELERTLSLIHI